MTRDHELQMSREQPEAICLPSETGRHQFFVTLDRTGKVSNVPASGIVTCAACGRYVEAYNGRWVLVAIPPSTTATATVARFLTLPKYVIREEVTIEDVFSAQ